MDRIDDLRNIRFIHCALPDLNLSEIKTTRELNVNGRKISVAPIAIEVSTEEEAVKLDGTHTLFYVKKADKFGVVEYRKMYYVADKIEHMHVADGLNLAKLIRMGGTVGIVKMHDLVRVKEIEEQLRIAMFLTNSGDLAALRKAAVVIR